MTRRNVLVVFFITVLLSVSIGSLWKKAKLSADGINDTVQSLDTRHGTIPQIQPQIIMESIQYTAIRPETRRFYREVEQMQLPEIKPENNFTDVSPFYAEIPEAEELVPFSRLEDFIRQVDEMPVEFSVEPLLAKYRVTEFCRRVDQMELPDRDPEVGFDPASLWIGELTGGIDLSAYYRKIQGIVLPG